ncbi:hypothetical protein M0812_07806 [Anaeramoeba flamelloides]|uniref:Uncharacterized protein n=1 Tax=Anaeramoeba flamelloides TaxID=1746091 RepID=A0AAV8A2M8_9EUKA|nr:hypothetical protein M0812_07806 [Anaeramoeba flamelloides]
MRNAKKKILDCKCGFNGIRIKGKTQKCNKTFTICDFVGNNLNKKCMEMRIKLTSPLICKKHSVLLQNKYRKKDYTSEKNESLQMNHDFNPMGTPSDEPPTNFENDNSFGIGGFETDFSESGLPIDDNIEDISSNSESEMEEFPYQIVPKSIKTQKIQNKYKRNRINHSNLLYWKQISQDLDCEVFSDYDEDSDYYEDLSNTNTTNLTTKKQNIQQNIPQIFPKKNAIKHIQIPLSIEDIKTQIQFCKDNICDFKVDLSIYNVFDPNWNNINNETPNTNYSEQPRLLYENFLKSKNLQKDLFEWKLKSNTPSVHFKDLMKILQHYHPEEKLLCTPRVIRKRMLKEIGYDNIYNYYNNNTQNKKQTNERISTIKLRWDLKSKKSNKIIEKVLEVPYITITTWLDLIIQSKLKEYLLKIGFQKTNSDVNCDNFKPMEFYHTKKFKKFNLNPEDNQYDYVFFISLFIDAHSHKSSMRDNLKGVYMFIENFNVGARLKNHSIFLLMNLPKEVPIYDLKTRLPFISELLHLQQTKELFGKKVFIRLCSIAGDTVEQQPASGKLSHSSIEVCRHCCLSKHNEGFNLGKNIIFKDKNFDITRVNSDNDDFVIPTTRKRNSNQNNLENEMIDSTLIIQEKKKKIKWR